MGKMFDIHIEVGDVQTGVFYAKTILANGQAVIEKHGPNPSSPIMQVVAEMEQIGLWQILYNDPSISSYPFNTGGVPGSTSNSSPNVVVNNRKKKDPPKQLPSTLTGVDKPACQTLCTSFDHFGDSKCRSICASKK